MRLFIPLLSALALGGLASAALAETPLPVTSVIAHTTPRQQHFELSGSVEAAESVPVGFRNGGRLVAVLSDVGTQVEKGALLAQIDPAQARAAQSAAQAQFAAAEAMLDQAEQAHRRAADLTARGAVTQAALDAAIQSVLAAGAVRDQAGAQLIKADQALKDTEILAPVSGIVTARLAEPGQIVGAAQTVLTLAREGARVAVFHVPDIADLEDFMGRRFGLRLIDSEAPPFFATVTEIAPLMMTATGTVRVKAQIEATQPTLGAAVTGETDLPLSPAITLPWPALVGDETGPAVWTVEPQSRAARLTPVEVARYTDTGFEVVSGLAEGAEVVTAGAHLLYPGRVVAPVEGAP